MSQYSAVAAVSSLPAVRTRQEQKSLVRIDYSLCASIGLILALSIFLVSAAKPSAAPTLKVRDDDGQLQISFRGVTESKVNIVDGGKQISLGIAPDQSSLTYARHSGDVTIEVGSAQVRFIGPPPPPPQMERIRRGIEALESRTACLRAVDALNRVTLARWAGALKSAPNQ